MLRTPSWFLIFGLPANGGVRKGGLRSVWPPVLEIGLFRPFSAFSPFPGRPEQHLENPENGSKTKGPFFPHISSDLLKPPSLKPSFAVLQTTFFFTFRRIFLSFYFLFGPGGPKLLLGEFLGIFRGFGLWRWSERSQPRGPCETSRCLAAKVDSPLSCGNF